MVSLIILACVLYNFCLISDDFDERYFNDDDSENDGGHGFANPPRRLNEQ